MKFSLEKAISEYNRKIKSGGRKKYFFRLLITAVLQTIGLSILVSVIDQRYGNLPLKIIVLFLFFFIYNMLVGFLITWPRLDRDMKNK